MKKLLLLLGVALVALPTLARAQAPGSGQPFGFATGRYFCMNGAEALTADIASGTVNGDSKIVTGTTGLKVHMIAYDLFIASSGVKVSFEEGTGTNCGTGNTEISGPIFQTSAVNQTISSTAVLLGAPMITNTSGDDFCLKTSASTTLSGNIRYCKE